MKLNNAQIIALKSIISKGIEYTDVQMEILDHVASAVEDRMNADPSLTFEQAFVRAKTSFGIFGLSELQNSLINGIRKRYSQIFWKQFWSYFHLKFIGLVLFFGFLLYQVQVLINDQNKVMIGLIILTLVLLGMLVAFKLKFKQRKSLLVHSVSLNYLGSIGSFCLLLRFTIYDFFLTSFYGVNINILFTTIMLVFFVIYLTSSVKTAIIGIKETQELTAKYGQLTYN